MPIDFKEAALILLDLKNKGNQCRPSRHPRKETMTWAEIEAILVNHLESKSQTKIVEGALDRNVLENRKSRKRGIS